MAGTLVANTINTDTGLFSTQNAYQGIAKAWLQYNGSAGTIYNSFNVTSVTKNGTGDYTVNFTTVMPSANYAIVGNAAGIPSTANVFIQPNTYSGPTIQAPTASAFRFDCVIAGGTTYDSTYINIAVFSS